MPKKTFNEKLNHAGDLPKIITFKESKTMVIVPAVEYDTLMKKVPKGKVATIDRMMAHIAKKHHTDFACSMTAGIFVKTAAFASEERGGKKETPWWRTLKKGGQLSEKLPDGIDGQKIRLEAEGHTVIQKGKNYFVEDCEKKVFQNF